MLFVIKVLNTKNCYATFHALFSNAHTKAFLSSELETILFVFGAQSIPVICISCSRRMCKVFHELFLNSKMCISLFDADAANSDIKKHIISHFTRLIKKKAYESYPCSTHDTKSVQFQDPNVEPVIVEP